MRSCLLLLVWCGAALSQLRVPAGRAILSPRGKRPGFPLAAAPAPSAATTFAEPLPQVSATPPSPPPVAEFPEEDDYDVEAFRPGRPATPAAAQPSPPPPPPPTLALSDADEPSATRRPAFRPVAAPEPPRPAFRPAPDVVARPSFRPSPSTPVFRNPAPTQPPLADFPQPSRGPVRQPTRTSPEPQQRSPPPSRQVPLPPPVQARPQQQYQRTKKPVAQVIRRYREDNPDGSITWGFENDDGTFKEETIGVDCVVKGKYGYIDPDGVRREYTYNSGIPCDKNRQSENSGEGFIDYQSNQYVLPNGDSVDLDSVSKNKARKQIPPTYRNPSN
ncbi:uncharacterized protein LOC126298553 [Schistocerca gregaria]|uniref:uncharacterized protein LOC126298553 n=1 Tax=Schistocerca gregaria TaxID=7010 RepID=UPI00211E8F33|nr:uncharacterized protein LOC126298553 [Schistocerca gregaria]